MPDQTNEIDWRTDWIYQLVFQEVERYWQYCKLGSKVWRYVLVGEWALPQRANCSGDVVRGWVRDESGLYEISPEEYKQHERKIRARIFPFVVVSFHIYASRQRITMGHRMASTAGAGGEYLIEGEGAAAKLVFDPEGGFWIS